MEGLLWYLVLLDSLVYLALSLTKEKWHHKQSHWLSDHFPLHAFIAFIYLILVLWLGFALYRLQLIVFW